MHSVAFGKALSIVSLSYSQLDHSSQECFRAFSSLSQVIEELNLRVLYTTDERYMLKRSVYSKMISTSNSAVNPSQYLSITVDAEEKRQLEQQLKVRTS